MSRLLEALHSGRVLLMDGAMGTELQRRGLPDGEPPELWNLTHPEQVRAVHAAYLAVGAEVLVTNTFQTNRPALRRYELENRIYDIGDAALDIALTFQNPAPFVLVDVGPFQGPRLADYRFLLDSCRAADGALIETWTIRPAGPPLRAAAQRAAGGRPFPFLMSFTFRGAAGPAACAESASAAARFAENIGAAALGANCGAEIDMDDLLGIVKVYRGETDLPLFVRPNAGTPRRTAVGWDYPRSPEQMAGQLWPLLEAGVTMVGGCCGTTPAHIAAFRRVVDQWNANRPPKAGG